MRSPSSGDRQPESHANAPTAGKFRALGDAAAMTVTPCSLAAWGVRRAYGSASPVGGSL